MKYFGLLTVLFYVTATPSIRADEPFSPPIQVAPFAQQYQVTYTDLDGAPMPPVNHIEQNDGGALFAATPKRYIRLTDGTWKQGDYEDVFKSQDLEKASFEGLQSAGVIRQVVALQGERAAATETGLYLSLNDGDWALAMPTEGEVRWAPIDVRAVTFDGAGQLWFASPQGVGYRINEGEWKLFTGAEGLPFNDFTCMAAGPEGIWFGTSNGAIHYDGKTWEFRQGRRWLLDNKVNDVTVTANGNAWFATDQGISCIATKPMTLAEKAVYFEEQIDKYHRRTELEYVSDATMTTPGDKSTAAARATDNDGHFTGIYLASASLAFAATKDPEQERKAHKAFEALAFLSKVTEGGSNPAPKGLIARAVQPTDGPDPNETLNPETDRKRQERDTLWKIMDPRWPTDETGKWYWKCDASSDELDGYYFGFSFYYDYVCDTDAERERLNEVVRRMTDHLLIHDYNMVDHDGTPTRWGHFSPADLNQNQAWWVERGLNSQSILMYLQVAHHITGDAGYREAYLQLINEHGYAINVMTNPKIQFGPGSLGQADDNMAFMNYYPLIRYETDPELLSIYYNSIFWYWHNEKYERNAFFNFVYAASCLGKTRTDQWRTRDLTPDTEWMAMAVDTLKRYPLDLTDWPMSNAHRTDLRLLGDHTRSPGTPVTNAGYRNDTLVYPMDENHAVYWGDDPWTLTDRGDGTTLRDPVSYLLAYYLGVVHGFIAE